MSGLRRAELAVVAVVLQAAPGLHAGLEARRGTLLIASGVLLTGWFVINIRATRGACRIALAVALGGAALNLTVMVPNGGMPVSTTALAEIGRGDADVTDGQLYKHRVADETTHLIFLGDVLPLRPLGMVISIGDIALFVGLVWAVAAMATGAGASMQASRRANASGAPG